MSNQEIKNLTLQWIQSFVIEHNICPFASHTFKKKDYKIAVCRLSSYRAILEFVYSFYEPIENNHKISNAFIILPSLDTFESILNFKSIAEDFFENIYWNESTQIVAFHPKFCFEEETNDNNSNYVNRSPFPMLHFLKAKAVSKAINMYPDINNIPYNNKKKLDSMTSKALKTMLEQLQR